MTFHRIPCRICASEATFALPAGRYAAFFSLRVDTAKDPYLTYSRMPTTKARVQTRILRNLRQALKLPAAPAAPVQEYLTFMTGCTNCQGLTPTYEFSSEDLLGLYRDYRSETYNRDRISVEPGYARIAADVGNVAQEIVCRNTLVEAFLRRNATVFSPGGTMIDYGGSDGRFVTDFMYETFDRIEIFEPSDAPLHESVTSPKISKTANPREGAYNFLTCMHVLEHVAHPRTFVLDMLKFVAPGGLIYLELPHELDRQSWSDFEHRIIDQTYQIHEHINKLSTKSISKMVESIPGLSLVDQAEIFVDLGWTTGTNGYFLIRKKY